MTYEDGDEEVEEEQPAEGASGPTIHAPKPRGMLHLRPVFVSHQSSPAASSGPELHEGERITPPMTAVAPAMTMVRTSGGRAMSCSAGIEFVELAEERDEVDF